jgi:hypothetical protein
VRPLDHAQAALWYRKALASTLEGVYPRELRCFKVGPGVAYEAYAWPTPAPFLHSCSFLTDYAEYRCSTANDARCLPPNSGR